MLTESIKRDWKGVKEGKVSGKDLTDAETSEEEMKGDGESSPGAPHTNCPIITKGRFLSPDCSANQSLVSFVNKGNLLIRCCRF